MVIVCSHRDTENWAQWPGAFVTVDQAIGAHGVYGCLLVRVPMLPTGAVATNPTGGLHEIHQLLGSDCLTDGQGGIVLLDSGTYVRLAI